MLKIYLSHSIRGKFGANATRQQMADNCERALQFARWIREEFPEVKLYVPAETEPFVGPAYWHEYLTEKQILFIDCEIISNSKGMIVFSPDDFISKGMQVEIDFCKEKNIPNVIVDRSIKERERIEDFINYLKGLSNGKTN